MSTLKRKLASQANGKLSRGPVTAQGKRISSRNSMHHGLLANSYVLDGESRERFEQLTERLATEYQPSNETERALVDMMAIARWRQARVWGFERAAIDTEIAHQESAPTAAPSPEAPPQNHPTKAAAAFRTLADQSRVLDLLNRYDSFATRTLFRSQKQFHVLRAISKLAENEAVLEVASPVGKEDNPNSQTNLDVDFSESNEILEDTTN